MGELADSVAKAVEEGLLPRGEPLLIACSGGADSVALLAAAVEAGLHAAVGHVDHGLRAASADEAEAVRALAIGLGAPFYLERLEGLEVRGPGLEAAARVGRYAALARLAAQAGAAVVATAHTRRDQAETLLLRLIRGAGPGALAGVRRRRVLAPGVGLVRPLLEVPRSATEEFCRVRGLAFSSDPHNSDLARTRARLRKLWPMLLELNPRLEEALFGAAESLAEEDELLTALLPKDLRLDALRALPKALLRRALLRGAAAAGVHPERPHLAELQRLLERGSGALSLPCGIAEIRGDELCFRARVSTHASPSPEGPLPEVAVRGPGHYSWGPRALSVAAASASGEGFTVDVTQAPFPWTLRGHRPGDRFRPAGGRTAKVADLWIDAKVPRVLRKDLAVLCDAGGQLFWVEGLREGAPCRSPGTPRFSFCMRPEMKALDGRLTHKRRPESGSATMDPRPDEEQ